MDDGLVEIGCLLPIAPVQRSVAHTIITLVDYWETRKRFVFQAIVTDGSGSPLYYPVRQYNVILTEVG